MARWRSFPLVVSATVAAAMLAPNIGGASALGQTALSRQGPAKAPLLARSPELSTASRLADRRSYAIGDRFYEAGAEDGTYPAEGFHTRGEMGGFWSMPIKLLDGVWFGVNGSWLKARSYTSGWGYSRMDLGSAGGVQLSRTDFAPDGIRAGLIGLTFSSTQARNVQLTMDAHSELMSSYPWGETKPANQLGFNLSDTGSFDNGRLVFREQGTPAVANASAHDWAAVVGSSLHPTGHALGKDFRGPQDPAVICPASGGTPPAVQPARCDDTAYGKGTGGQLTYQLRVPAGSRTVWFAVSGSNNGLGEALAMQRGALSNPVALLASKVSERKAIAGNTQVALPGDSQLAQSVLWSKQNLADSRQEARDLQLRITNAGTVYPAPIGTAATARWIGAGFPDYPWIFGTDGEYSAFAAVAAGQFDSIKNHLQTLRRISEVVNKGSGKVVHEVVPDGSVFFGANADPGNTDETVKFPSTVALVWRWTGDNRFRDQMYDFTIRNLRYVFANLDADHDGWLEGAGNVERQGMGQEKLDNTVYAIRGLLDLADMAASKNDRATRLWATTKAQDLQRRFETAWWFARGTDSYADSLCDPGNVQLFQRYWIGLTPVEAELPARGGIPAGPLAAADHARSTVAAHESPAYTGANGLFHNGTGGSFGTCDPAVPPPTGDRTIFTLTTSIAAVAEAATGRTGATQLGRYTSDLARVQIDKSLWEVPGDMPEISPSPDFGANIDKKFTERSMGLQAWGTYGVLWPVVHFELGVSPDLGRGALAVVPQIPTGQSSASGTHIRLGTGSVDVTARRDASQLTTTVRLHHLAAALSVGAVLPSGRHASKVLLNGVPARHRTVVTARGTEIVVDPPRGVLAAQLRVSLGP
jgi:hypothetical protein